MTNHAVKKIIALVSFLLLTIIIFILLSLFGWLHVLGDSEKLLSIIDDLGLIGPIVIILLISSAIIITPIPSAPIALVSGALYGHTFGTIYVVAGALFGALIAFTISRKLGYDYVSNKLYHRMPEKIVGSQNTLMLLVFATRLVPFISFDVISYAAGLTKLTFARFFIATFMGIIPISFMLAHLGSEAKNGEMESIVIALILIGFITLVPLIIQKLATNSYKG